MLAPWKESYNKPRHRIKNQRCYFADKGLYSQSYGYSSSHVWMWELDHKEGWALKNWCLHGAGEVSWASLGLQGDQASQSWRKSAPNMHWKDWCWSWNSNNLSTWCEQLTHWKRPWCWEGLKVGEKRGDRGWHGWMTSLTQWTWVWTNFGKWWRTGKPGMLQSMGSQTWTQLSNWTTKVYHSFPSKEQASFNFTVSPSTVILEPKKNKNQL